MFDLIKKGDSVLDVGCGNGRLLDALKEKDVQYLGLDFSEQLIAQARAKYPDNEFRVADLTVEVKLPKQYDAVFLVAVLNHFDVEHQDFVMRQVNSFLKPGGLLLMTNWNLWNILYKKSVWQAEKLADGVKTVWRSGSVKATLYYYPFTKRRISRLLTRNGFEIVQNFYSRRGSKSNIFLAQNIVTVAKKIN